MSEQEDDLPTGDEPIVQEDLVEDDPDADPDLLAAERTGVLDDGNLAPHDEE